MDPEVQWGQDPVCGHDQEAKSSQQLRCVEFDMNRQCQIRRMPLRGSFPRPVVGIRIFSRSVRQNSDARPLNNRHRNIPGIFPWQIFREIS
jgi:hypothetical protein